jgi:phosphohistidine phosphatase
MAPASDLICKETFLLLLVRHGKAAPKDIGLSDFGRILVRTGVHECKRVLEKLKGKKIAVDLMISSPADRALETAHLFARRLGYPVQKIKIADILYAADSIQPVAAFIRSLDNAAHTVEMIGHNPILNELTAHFLPDFSQNIPTGAIVGIQFKAASWVETAKGQGKLAFFLTLRGCKR